MIVSNEHLCSGGLPFERYPTLGIRLRATTYLLCCALTLPWCVVHFIVLAYVYFALPATFHCYFLNIRDANLGDLPHQRGMDILSFSVTQPPPTLYSTVTAWGHDGVVDGE